MMVYTGISGVGVDTADPANQQPFVLERIPFSNALPSPRKVDLIASFDGFGSGS